MILDFGDGFFLRHATADDDPALCMICVRTGDAGKDATDREDDPTLMGQIYAVPYRIFEPDLAFVIAAPGGIAGYLFGALDTAAFYECLACDWYPALQRRVTNPGPDRSLWRGSDWARHLIHNPDFAIPQSLAAYPSHGHIDLLPNARGRGIGQRSMRFLENRLVEAGSTGLFLDVHPENTSAQHFYEALGYEHVSVAAEPQNPVFMAKHFTD